MTPIKLPPEARLAVHATTASNGVRAWVVLVTGDGIDPKIDLMAPRGTTAAVLTRDQGFGFPDDKSIAFAEAVLAEGGVISFAFRWDEAAHAWAKHLREAVSRALADPDTCQDRPAHADEGGSPE